MKGSDYMGQYKMIADAAIAIIGATAAAKAAKPDIPKPPAPPPPEATTDEALPAKRETEKKLAMRRGLASTIRNSVGGDADIYKPQLGGLGSGGSGNQKKKLLGQ